MKKIIASLLIGFILGAGTAWHFKHKLSRKSDSNLHFKMVMWKFSHKLDLNDEQKEKVAAILLEKRKKIDAVRSEMRPKFENIRKETRAEISKILTPEQQKKYDIMDAEMSARRQKRK